MTQEERARVIGEKPKTDNPESAERSSAAAQTRDVLVIDDEEIMLRSCRQVLEKGGYEVETFNNGKDGIDRFAEKRPPLVIVDLKMPEVDGFKVIDRIQEIDKDTIIIVITGYATVATAVDAMRAGAYDFLPKPFTPDELRLIIDRAYERWYLVSEAQRLRREKEETERRFLRFVTHQLKSPLVAVKQCLDTLEYISGDELSEGATEWISRAQARIDEMSDIMTDWLTLERIEKGTLCDAGASINLADIVHQVIARRSQQAESAGVTIEADVPEVLPELPCNEVCITTLLCNLLNNAIKYNRREGNVRIRVSDSEESVKIEIADTGIGIPEDRISQIFLEFYRVKNDADMQVSGTGLGLAICKAIVSELGGSIKLSSEENKGSTFTVCLPKLMTKP